MFAVTGWLNAVEAEHFAKQDSNKREPSAWDFADAAGGPITNRPQVNNLPHKKIVAACEETDELSYKRRIVVQD
jgi:hypothetical protein